MFSSAIVLTIAKVVVVVVYYAIKIKLMYALELVVP